jgi:dolichol kinase
MIPPLPGILIVIAAFMALVVAAKLFQETTELHPEIPRKLIHVGMGLVALGLPWLFSDRWPVVVLTLVSFGLLLAIRMLRVLRDTFGGALIRIGRPSHGDLYFGPVVCGLFLITSGELLLYLVPVLILVTADTAAAGIGKCCGRVRYRVGGGLKSLEGSLAFLAVAAMRVAPAVSADGQGCAAGAGDRAGGRPCDYAAGVIHRPWTGQPGRSAGCICVPRAAATAGNAGAAHPPERSGRSVVHPWRLRSPPAPGGGRRQRRRA